MHKDSSNFPFFLKEMPYLQKPWLQFSVQQNIESQDFETDTFTSWRLTGSAHSIRMQDMRLCYNQSLYNQLLHI